MARKRTLRSTGTVVQLQHRSKLLADNPLGDPAERTLGVWLPHEYDTGTTRGRGRRFPVFYDLVGFTGTGIAHLNWKPFSENVAERAARLVQERRSKTASWRRAPTTDACVASSMPCGKSTSSTRVRLTRS